MDIIEEARNGNLERVISLIDESADIKKKNRILIIAIENGFLDIVKYLISIGADIHLENDILIHLAIKHNQTEIISFMIDNGADIYSNGDIVTYNAVINNNTDTVKLLVQHDKKIHEKYCNALQLLAKRGNLDTLEYLIDYGTINKKEFLLLGVDIYDAHLKALNEACAHDHLHIVSFLIENDHIHSEIEFPLSTSACKGNLSIVQYLMEYDSKHINKALFYGVINGHYHVAKYLLENGANPNYNDNMVTVAAIYGHIEVVTLLMDYGHDIHRDNDCIFRECCIYDQYNMIKFLLENGVNPDNYNQALLNATSNGRLKIVELLLEYGANNHEALYYSAKYGSVKVTQLLLNRGFNNNNALSISIKNGHFTISKLLMEYGMNDPLNNDLLNYLEFVKLMIKHGIKIDEKYDCSILYDANNNYDIVLFLEQFYSFDGLKGFFTDSDMVDLILKEADVKGLSCSIMESLYEHYL